MRRYFPLENESARPTYNIQEAEIVGEVERVVLGIYAAQKDHQKDHQSTVLEVAGKIVEQSVSVLIDPRSTHNYIAPRIVEICALRS